MNPYLVKAESTPQTASLLNSKIDSLNVMFKRRSDFHCTLMFASTWSSVPKLLVSYKKPYSYKVKDVNLFGSAIVLILDAGDNSFIVKRHNELKCEMHATTDHNVYSPHMTIGYTIPGQQLDIVNLRKSFIGLKVSVDRENGKVFRNHP